MSSPEIPTKESLLEHPIFWTYVLWIANEADQQHTEAELHQAQDLTAIEEMMMLKAGHTGEVMQAMWDIVGGEDSLTPYLIACIVAAITHDVKRFEQARQLSFSDAGTNFYHAKIGAEHFEATAPNGQTKFLTSPTLPPEIQAEIAEFYLKYGTAIRLAIQLHSDKTVNTTQFDEMTALIVLATRDADKLALMREWRYYLLAHIEKYADVDMTNQPLKQTVIDAFLNGELVTNGEANTKSNRILHMLAWIFDIQFETTKRLLINEGIVDSILGLLKTHLENYHDYDDVYDQVKAKVDEWKNSVSTPETV